MNLKRGLALGSLALACLCAQVHAKPVTPWKPPAARPAVSAGSASANASPSESCGDDMPRSSAPLGTGVLASLDSAAVMIPTLGSPSRGPAGARVTLVEFSDFQCPSCKQAYVFLDSLAREFPRDLRIVFKHYPLQFHPYAFAAAEAAMAAMDQGKFWEYADVVYAHQDEIDQDALLGWSCTVGLDVRAFSKSLYAGQWRARVRIDMADADRVGVRGTPMLYLNGHGYWGRRTMRDMVPVVRALLAQHGASPASAPARDARTGR